VSLLSKVREETSNLFLSHFAWMALVVKENELFDPMRVGFVGSGAAMPQ